MANTQREIALRQSIKKALFAAELFTDQVTAAKPSEMHPWVGSALFWISVADDLFEEEARNRGARAAYTTERNNSIPGRTLLSLNFARNEVAHGGGVVVSEGLMFPLVFPLNFGGNWVAADQLAAHYESRGRTVKQYEITRYATTVAERPVIEPLQLVTGWLRKQEVQ